MAAIAPLPSPVPQVPQIRVPVRLRRPRTPAWLGSAVMSAVALGALASLVPPAVGAVAAGQVLPREAARPSVALEGTISTAGLPDDPVTSVLVVRNTGSEPISWRVRSEVTGPGASGVRIDTRLAVAGTCTGAADGAALGEQTWSQPLAAGGSTTLCVTVTATDPTAGDATPTVHVDAHAA
jgi:hypothetical protein